MIQIGEYSVELKDVIEAAEVSNSYIDILRNLNIDYNTNRIKVLRKIIEQNNIDVSNFTREQKAKPERVKAIRDAIKQSTSIREALMRLNLAPRGGNYKCIKKVIEDFDIDITHFTSSSIGKTFIERNLPINTYLKYKAPAITTSKLKHKLINEGILERKCYNCNNTEWLGQPIPLELEHKDGNNQNGTQENLTLLCPNCHALTDTYRGKNKGTYSN